MTIKNEAAREALRVLCSDLLIAAMRLDETSKSLPSVDDVSQIANITDRIDELRADIEDDLLNP